MLPEFEKLAAARQAASRIKDGKIPGDAARGATGQKREAAADVAKVFGIGATTVKAVKRVAKAAPELMPKLRSGEMSASEAEREVRVRKAREMAKAEVGRTKEKKRQADPREVKGYLEACRRFKAAVKEAVDVAAYGKFSPEAQKFATRWHDEIRTLLSKVEAQFHV